MIRFAWAAALTLAFSGQAFAAGYGSVEGQFVLDGDVPAVAPLLKKGDAAARDSATCTVEDVPNDALAIDPDSKGIGNIFFFMRKAPKNIHPDLVEAAKEEIVFDQKYCRFLPYGLVVQTNQPVRCISDDDVPHNVNIIPLKNSGKNFMVKPNDRTGTPVEFSEAEVMPSTVKCDIHPWMEARWLIVDHPYAVVTDKDGKFKLENVPEGEHEFRAWHTGGGWIERSLKVTVKDGQATVVKLKPVKFSALSK